MLKTMLKYFWVLPFFSLFPNCSPSAVSGTETGNPGIVTCALAAFDLNDSAEWLPQSYLVNGILQLDPGFLSTEPEVIKIAKRSMSAVDSSDSGLVNVVNKIDTIITMDTIYVVDTIIEHNTLSDTVIYMKSDGSGDSSVLISERIFTDSIFVVDTVVMLDTFVVEHIDTTFDNSSPSDSTILIPISPVTLNAYYRSDTVFYSVVRPNYSSTEMVADGAGIEFRYDSSLIWISRNSFISGMVIYEEYRDGDGDSLLCLSKSTLSPSSRLLASYTSADSKMDLLVHFDAGFDAQFPTVADNQIFSLKRTINKGDLVTEEVLYGKEFNGSSGDTIFLTVRRATQSDIEQSSFTRYSSITDSAISGHNGNQLTRINKNVFFRSGNLKEMKLTITPDHPVEAESGLQSATLEIFINYGKGLTGEFMGSINYITGIVSGIYAEGGNEYSVRIDKKTSELEQIPLQ